MKHRPATVALNAASGPEEDEVDQLLRKTTNNQANKQTKEDRVLPRKNGSPTETDPLAPGDAPKARNGPNVSSFYNRNRRRVISTLRQDYPLFFTKKPDLSIYTEDIEVYDAKGRLVSGIWTYGRTFAAVRFLRKISMDDAEMVYSVCPIDDKVRVQWSATLWARWSPLFPLYGVKNPKNEPIPFQLDGVSIYDLNDDGLICQQRLENLVLDGPPVPQPLQLKGFPRLGLRLLGLF